MGGERYRIVRPIASGGMAEVFEGRSVGSHGVQRRVAIKRIRGDCQDEAFGRMFLDEARIASQLSHANVVAMLDYGLVDGIPFMVLEYVDGYDGKGLWRRGRDLDLPMPVEVALHLCAEIAFGLGHVHCAKDTEGQPLGIVHRDVSPHNILVSRDGDVKLADFGIAFAHDRVEQTADGTVKGKFAYMAPEQLMGGTIDGRTDVFSLGCVLHAFIAGRSPLDNENSVVQLLSEGGLTLGSGLPEDVRRIVAKATARDRARRFPSAMAMAEACAEAIARRTRTSPRAILLRWLESLDEPEPGLEQISPEQLIEIVIEENADPETRAFRSLPTAPQGRRSRGLAGADVTPSGTTSPVAGWVSSRSKLRWLAAATTVALIGAVGLAGFIASRGEVEAASPPRAAGPARVHLAVEDAPPYRSISSRGVDDEAESAFFGA